MRQPLPFSAFATKLVLREMFDALLREETPERLPTSGDGFLDVGAGNRVEGDMDRIHAEILLPGNNMLAVATNGRGIELRQFLQHGVDIGEIRRCVVHDYRGCLRDFRGVGGGTGHFCCSSASSSSSVLRRHPSASRRAHTSSSGRGFEMSSVPRYR